MELWHVISIALAGILLGAGLIMTWYWLVAIGFLFVPIAAIWGLVASGPGSSHNPYHQH